MFATSSHISTCYSVSTKGERLIVLHSGCTEHMNSSRCSGDVLTMGVDHTIIYHEPGMCASRCGSRLFRYFVQGLCCFFFSPVVVALFTDQAFWESVDSKHWMSGYRCEFWMNGLPWLVIGIGRLVNVYFSQRITEYQSWALTSFHVSGSSSRSRPWI